MANFYCCKSSNFVYGVLYLKGFVYVDIESVLYSLDKRAYEQFIEHLDRCIYGSIWVGEGSKIVNIKGYRLDVLNAIKGIRPSMVRWPGGNFALQYHWLDGVGPRKNKEDRQHITT